MQNTRQIARRAFKLANYVVSVVPAVESPEARVQGNGPVRSREASVVEPAGRLPVVARFTFEAEPGGGDNDADDGDADEGDELEEHKEVADSGGKAGGETVEERDEDEASNGNGLVDPGVDYLNFCAYCGSDDVFSKDDGDNCCASRF